MAIIRRRFLGLCAAAVAAPHVARSQERPPFSRTVRAVLHSDLRIFDPVWTTANITFYHASMVYDQLFGVDSNFRPQPQMVGRWSVSDDRKTYVFELRDHLAFSDGSPVRARDCVASIRRWAARDPAGQHLFRRVVDLSVKDDKTFQIALAEPYGLVIEALAKVNLYIMRENEAQTDPNQQIRTIVGSGPFVFNENERRPGHRYVYDRNPNYVPRSEPASFTAGGKIVKVDRVAYENIADEGTALSALGAGEVDLVESANVDLLDQIKNDPAITVQPLDALGRIAVARLNWLHPPFNNVKARQAMLYAMHPSDAMKATFGDPRYFSGCASLFGCGSPMQNDANTEWFKGGRNVAKARELLAESGYDGRLVVVLQPTDISFLRNAAVLAAGWMREVGFNVSLQASDWGAILQRRAVKAPPDQGGWNMFPSAFPVSTLANPAGVYALAATGERAWFGWPSDETHERLRDKWAQAPTSEERKAIAREIQENAWNIVLHVNLGQYVQPSAWRNLTGVIAMPDLIPFWNMQKTA